MYSNQSGCFVYITQIIGLGIIGGGIMQFMDNIPLIPSIIEEAPIWEFAITFILMGFLIFYLGLFFVSMFPQIRVANKGIKFKYLLSTPGKIIKWDEIDEIVNINKPKILKDYKAVVIRKKGFSMLNQKGLHFQALHGLLIGSDLPVILLSPSLLNQDDIIGQIMSKDD